jgi:hypothetical protein
MPLLGVHPANGVDASNIFDELLALLEWVAVGDDRDAVELRGVLKRVVLYCSAESLDRLQRVAQGVGGKDESGVKNKLAGPLPDPGGAGAAGAAPIANIGDPVDGSGLESAITNLAVVPDPAGGMLARVANEAKEMAKQIRHVKEDTQPGGKFNIICMISRRVGERIIRAFIPQDPRANLNASNIRRAMDGGGVQLRGAMPYLNICAQKGNKGSHTDGLPCGKLDARVAVDAVTALLGILSGYGGGAGGVQTRIAVTMSLPIVPRATNAAPQSQELPHMAAAEQEVVDMAAAGTEARVGSGARAGKVARVGSPSVR